MRSRSVLACSLLLLALGTAGCSGDDGSDDNGADGGRDLAGRFEAAAEQAAADAADARGAVPSPCFVLDDEAADRIAESLGLDDSPRLDDSAVLGGSGVRASVQCSYAISSMDQAPPVGIVVARTDEDLEAYVDGVRDLDDPPAELDVDVEGSDGDVVALSKYDYQQVVLVRDGLRFQLGGREQDVELDELAQTMPVLVDEVDRVLSSQQD